MVALTNDECNLLWSQLCIEELYRLGIRQFCLSPGNRSASLSVTLVKYRQQKQDIVITTFIDERAAAFYAVGYGRKSNTPAVLICTSGTAVANYFPAVIEAHYSGVPLVIISADRPPELRESSANQAIDQVKLFHSYCLFYMEIPTPNVEIAPSYFLSTIDHAVQISKGQFGVVHLNCMFREPLIKEYKDMITLQKERLPQRWVETSTAYSNIINHTTVVDSNAIDGLIESISNATRGIILLGNINFHNTEEYSAINHFLETLHWPVYADILSGFKNKHYTIPFLDFLCEDIIHELDCIIFIGDRVVSSRIYSILSKTKALQIKIIDRDIHSDPTHTVSVKLLGSIEYTVTLLTQKLEHHYVRESYFFESLLNRSSHILKVVQLYFSQQEVLSSAVAVTYIINHIPQEYGMYVSNSMSIRLLNDFMFKSFLVAGNRGASGIDGTLASAIGYANSLERPVVFFIGDLSLVHDINSLYLLQKSKVPLFIILINDNGGGIFSVLPFSKEKTFSDIFEEAFIVPHNTNFESIVNGFNVEYYKSTTIESLINGISFALDKILQNKSVVLELALDHSINQQRVANLYQCILDEKSKIRS